LETFNGLDVAGRFADSRGTHTEIYREKNIARYIGGRQKCSAAILERFYEKNIDFNWRVRCVHWRLLLVCDVYAWDILISALFGGGFPAFGEIYGHKIIYK
jgi:hypothetical protein